ncbi:hypothetical protein [Nakamurella leprariae]|uniref:Uncharacterized protein n=1 Tax=Nakamurella leprariae TaxID=2803911 RepID=A0A938Y7D2_9ACTN|nr:hypothetical protein [Nakamurella leprariae]MBM9467175.1 hypothetical protein [Nakamurella leprariae]
MTEFDHTSRTGTAVLPLAYAPAVLLEVTAELAALGARLTWPDEQVELTDTAVIYGVVPAETPLPAAVVADLAELERRVIDRSALASL